MRVLHVDTAHDWGGGQNQVRLLVDRLAQQGIEQLCICRAGSELDRRLRKESLPVESVQLKGPLQFGRHIHARARDFDVVHAHDALALRATIIPAQLRRRPLIATRRTMSRTGAGPWRHPRGDAVSRGRASPPTGVCGERIRVIRPPSTSTVIAPPPASPTLREVAADST